MNIHRSLLTLVSLFCFWHVNCQTQEEFDAFAQEVLDEAELFSNLVKAAELTTLSEGSEQLAYKLPNDNIKTISWRTDSPNEVVLSNVYNSNLEFVNQDTSPRELSPSEKILISAYNETKRIIESGDLDLQDRKTILKPIFVFQNQAHPDIEHSNTELIVYLVRDDIDEKVVPMGGDFYMEFDGNGGLNDFYSIDQDYFHPFGRHLYEGEEVTGLLHGHSRTEDPIISSTEICSIMLHEDIITWDDLTVKRTYTDSTYTEAIYNVKERTLTIKESIDPNYNIPNFAVLIKDGERKYFEYFKSSEEVSEKIFDKIDESLTKGYIIYKPDEAFAKYPNLTVGRLGLIEIVLKKTNSNFYPRK